MRKLLALLLTVGLSFGLSITANAETTVSGTSLANKESTLLPLKWPDQPARFVFDSGYDFDYPDAVRGIYVTGHSAGGQRLDSLINLVDNSDLNAMVIDIKDDYGNITYEPPSDSPLAKYGKPYINNPKALMKKLEEQEIYPIARIVVFKDSVLAEENPGYSFKKNGSIWKNSKGEAFVNPFVKDVWEHNLDVAKAAAKMGFQEIQFDYVRFPEGFEKRDQTLDYQMGEYSQQGKDSVQARVNAVTDFVKYAKKELESFDVDVSVDIFGYTATLPEAPGIGQNFLKISKNVDVISSMIYPSHWTSYFGIQYPDTQPYDTVNAYSKVENKKLSTLDDPPTSRPWIQDFTTSWLGSGNYLEYGKAEIEAQIKALQDNGIDEFLIWDAGNSYTENVDYTP